MFRSSSPPNRVSHRSVVLTNAHRVAMWTLWMQAHTDGFSRDQGCLRPFAPSGLMTFQHALLLPVRIVFARPAGPAFGGFCFRLRHFYSIWRKRACSGLSAPRQPMPPWGLTEISRSKGSYFDCILQICPTFNVDVCSPIAVSSQLGRWPVNDPESGNRVRRH